MVTALRVRGSDDEDEVDLVVEPEDDEVDLVGEPDDEVDLVVVIGPDDEVNLGLLA